MAHDEVKSVREEMKDTKVGVLMGGQSEEREVSLCSGETVYKSLEKMAIKAVKIDPDGDLVKAISDSGADIMYNTLHGSFGEDGRMQGLLDSLRVPYTAEHVLQSAVSFNKITAKEILKANSIFTPAFMKLPNNFAFLMEHFHYHLDFPIVYKPESSGSSFGVQIIEDASSLKERFEKDINDIKEHHKYFIEEYIEGREIVVGVFQFNNTIHVLPIVEVKTKRPFYDFDAKYTKGLTEMIVPAKIEKHIDRNIHETAKKIYKAFHYHGCIRIDMVIAKNDVLFILEIDTQPVLSDTSDMIHMIKQSDFSLEDMILINLSEGKK
ncbi:D-alanine--D-alanine ligase [Spirochaetota bacterium]